LATWLARFEAAGCTHVVMEVSSHALAQARVAGVRFDAGCVTNVRQDHLDYHGTLENYASAKARLIDYLRPRGLMVLNADDPVSWSFVPRISGPLLSVGMDNEAELTASVIERLRSEQTFLLTAGRDTAPVRTPLVGDHNVMNCLSAVAIGLAYGVDLETAVRGIESVERVSGRLERIECGQPFGVFVDYAHTPHALTAALDALRPVTEGKLICLFGAGGQRDRAKRPLMGRAVESRADLLIITTDNPREEDPETIVAGILAGVRNRAAVEVISDRAAAIHRALSLAAPGDTVLLAGKGHEEYQLIGQERRMFDDREVARRWLYNLALPTDAPWPVGVWSKVANS
jgi:UDP-N-acetylmuramoyl-L-alanyl-D-glutamate--2,6-diaminopimelate ligase